MTFVLLLCIFTVFYAYFGYPICLWLLIKLGFRRRKAAPIAELPSVTIIITVRNEQGSIRGKLDNTLDLRFKDKFANEGGVQIIVASDASDDGTDKIVLAYAADGVELVRLEARGGKEVAQKKAIESARGDIIIFTDSKIELEPHALELFVQYFQDSAVGAVSSVDRIEGQESGEGAYVRYEMWLRSLESEFSTLIGLSGSCFAVRRSIAANIRSDIPSDFALLLEARRQGLAGVHAPDIIGTYQAVATHEAEFKRKVRTVLRGITTLFASAEVMNVSRYGSFSWQVISHKLCRWLVPWACLLGAGLLIALAMESWAYLFLELGMWAFCILAAVGYFHPDYREKLYCKLPLYFVIVNAAILMAWLNFFAGKRTVAWNPSDKGK